MKKREKKKKRHGTNENGEYDYDDEDGKKTTKRGRRVGQRSVIDFDRCYGHRDHSKQNYMCGGGGGEHFAPLSALSHVARGGGCGHIFVSLFYLSFLLIAPLFLSPLVFVTAERDAAVV